MSQIREEQLVQETKILGKINAVHREAFGIKYPNQVEHILRLLSERLQLGLDKRAGVDATDTKTWKLSPGELADLAEAMYHVHQIRESLTINAQNERNHQEWLAVEKAKLSARPDTPSA